MTVHEHTWTVKATDQCGQGHEIRVSTCPCGAGKQEWPETGEWLVLDWRRDGSGEGFRCFFTSHYLWLFEITRAMYVTLRLQEATANAPMLPSKAELN